MDEILKARVRRIYAAIGEDITDDLSKFTPALWRTRSHALHEPRLGGGLSDEQLSNLAHIAINNVANLRNHL